MIVRIGKRQIEAVVQTRPSDTAWGGRESKAITAQMTYQEAIETFKDDVGWSVIADVTMEDGTVHQVETDASEYAISGPITDNRDGTVTVRMGKYREEELMSIPLAEAPKTHAEAMLWRGIIEDVVQAVPDDAHALAVAPLHPEWAKLVGATVSAGYRFRHEGNLYRVLVPNHTFAANWVPGIGTESLYVRIDETHAGTGDDPIPYDGNMELTEGLYYVQGDVVYLCTRSTGAPVYNALADLIGIYVESVV